MQENYQPVVLRKILLSKGATREEIEEELRKYNPESESQSMTNTVLTVLQNARNQIIKKEGNKFVINTSDEFTPGQIENLVSACNRRILTFEIRFFIALGPWSNWDHTLKNPPFRWGVNPSSASNVGVFNALRPGDIVYFYANQDPPTQFSNRGLFGVGKVIRKYDEDKELYWPDEKLKGEVIYKHRFEIESLKLVKSDSELLPWIDGLPFTKGLNRIANPDMLNQIIDNTEKIWNMDLNNEQSVHYWKIAPGQQAEDWENQKNNGIIGIAWNELGDLSGKTHQQVHQKLKEIWPTTISNTSTQFRDFLNIKEGDIIIANKGKSKILGIGKVIGPYKFRPELEFAHTFPVNWFDLTEREIPQQNNWFITINSVSSDLYNSIMTNTWPNQNNSHLEELIKKFDDDRNYFNSNRESEYERNRVRDEFVAKFSFEKLKTMKITEYVQGRKDPQTGEPNKTTFCYMLERGIPGFGGIGGTPAIKFGIYWHDTSNQYLYKGDFDSPEAAFEAVRNDVITIIDAGNQFTNDRDLDRFSDAIDDKSEHLLTSHIRSKILALYFPKHCLAIHSRPKVIQLLDYFGIDRTEIEDRLTVMQSKLLEIKQQHPIMNKWSIQDYSYLLWHGIVESDEDEIELEDNDEETGNYYIITQYEGSRYDDIPGVQYAFDSDKPHYKKFTKDTNFIVQTKIDNQNYFVGYGKVGKLEKTQGKNPYGSTVTKITAKFSKYTEFPEKKLRTEDINEKMLNIAFPNKGRRNIPPAMLPITKELYDEIIGDELESSVESEKPYSFEEFENFLDQILELDMYGLDATGKHPKLDVKTLQLFFKITYYCALKVTEVIELRKNDFDIENRILTVNDSKAGKPGNQITTIPSPIISELIPFLNSIKGNERLFDITRQSIWKLTSKIAERIDKNGNRRITPEIFRKSYGELMATNHADHNLITLKLRNAFPSSTYGTLPTLNDLKKWEERIFEKPIQNNLNLKSFKNSKLVFPPNLNEAKNEIQKQLLIPADVIDRIIFSLYSGKHVILTGPVGTGKTHLAKLIPKIAWSKIGGYYPETVTATSEWTTQDVVGGIFPKIDRDQVKYSIQKGCVSDTISKNWVDETGNSNERIKFKKEGVEYNGVWLVIDEFNRANIDRAFGPLFTALEYKKLQIPTTKPDESYEELTIPEDYRIIGTLNTFDKHFLFRLSDALKRRFSFIEILPPTYDKIIEEVRFVSDKALENYDEIKQELKIQNFEDLRKNPEVYSLLTNLYEIMAFVRLSKNLGTAVLISMFRFALINYQQTKNLDNSLDAAVLTHLLPHLESLQYWQIDSIMNFVGGRIHEMFRKFDVNKRPDVDRYEEELRNLTKYLRVSGTNKSAGNWIAKFRTGEIFKLPTPITDLDPWSNKKRPVLQRFREALESLKKEKGYFEEAEGLNE